MTTRPRACTVRSFPYDNANARLHGEVGEQAAVGLLVADDGAQLVVRLLHDALHRVLARLQHLDPRVVELLGVLAARARGSG